LFIAGQHTNLNQNLCKFYVHQRWEIVIFEGSPPGEWLNFIISTPAYIRF